MNSITNLFTNVGLRIESLNSIDDDVINAWFAISWLLGLMSGSPEWRFLVINCAKAAKRRSNKERKAIKEMILLVVAFFKKLFQLKT